MDKLDIPLIECCFEQGVSNFVFPGDLVKMQILILEVWVGPEVLNFVQASDAAGASGLWTTL